MGTIIDTGCGSGLLEATTSSSRDKADSDSPIFGNVKVKNENWAGWRHLDNSGCNDFEKGNTDNFSAFDDVIEDADVEAVAFYNCGSDAWIVDQVAVYGDPTLFFYYFCEWIGGGPECGKEFYNENYDCIGEDIYNRYWTNYEIDNGDGGCGPRMIMGKNAGTSTLAIVWDGTDPGEPDAADCSAASFGSPGLYPNQHLFPDTVIISAVTSLIIMAFCVGCYFLFNFAKKIKKQAIKQSGYVPVNVDVDVVEKDDDH